MKYRNMCFSKIENCYDSIEQHIKSGMSKENAWNATTIKLTKAAEVILIIIFYIIH